MDSKELNKGAKAALRFAAPQPSQILAFVAGIGSKESLMAIKASDATVYPGIVEKGCHRVRLGRGRKRWKSLA